jgi:hypothetical protein
MSVKSPAKIDGKSRKIGRGKDESSGHLFIGFILGVQSTKPRPKRLPFLSVFFTLNNSSQSLKPVG